VKSHARFFDCCPFRLHGKRAEVKWTNERHKGFSDRASPFAAPESRCLERASRDRKCNASFAWLSENYVNGGVAIRAVVLQLREANIIRSFRCVGGNWWSGACGAGVQFKNCWNWNCRRDFPCGRRGALVLHQIEWDFAGDRQSATIRCRCRLCFVSCSAPGAV
jgi:hypothetical protein